MNKTKKIKIETPMGSIESDSGNHLADLATVIILSFFLVFLIKLIKKS